MTDTDYAKRDSPKPEGILYSCENCGVEFMAVKAGKGRKIGLVVVESSGDLLMEMKKDISELDPGEHASLMRRLIYGDED
ncbi:MAG: hypothetical protein Q8R12_04290 [bacterium]|nr:hypothetical protein [bacterium]